MWSMGPAYYCLFLTYIAFFIFVMTNVVTSVFIETALHQSTKDDELLAREHMRKKQHYVQSVKDIFDHLDKDEKGAVSVREFQNHLHDTSMIAFGAELDL